MSHAKTTTCIMLLLLCLPACEDHVRPSEAEQGDELPADSDRPEDEPPEDEAEAELPSPCAAPRDTGGHFEYREDQFSKNYWLEAHFVEGCVEYQVWVKTWEHHFMFGVEVCNRCAQPRWLEHYRPASGWPSLLEVDPGLVDLTGALVDANGLSFFADCGYRTEHCYDELLRERTKLEPGTTQVIRGGGSIGITGARYLPEFEHTGPLAIDFYLPRLWPEAVPVEQRYPERARAITCVMSGQLAFCECEQPCVNSLELEPWSPEQLLVRRVENIELPAEFRCKLDPACED